MTDAKRQHINHDLRTPLNHLIGYSELLAEEAADRSLPTALEPLNQIRRIGKQLIARLTEVFADRNVPPHIPLSDAQEGLITQVVEVTSLTAQLYRLLPDDLAPDLQKLDKAVANFSDLVKRFSLPPSEDDVPMVGLPVFPEIDPEPLHGTLLVVDDIADNRVVLGQLLERQGHTIQTAENGQQALDMVLLMPPDMVLLDLMMPVLDGYETLRRLKSERSTRHIPVLIVSALDEMNGVVRCIEAGADDYLMKPFDPVLLRARVNAALERKQMRAAEVEYLQQVALLTHAARTLESDTFEPELLAPVAAREDALGNLARVFTRMAHEVYTRELRLRDQAAVLRVAVNEDQAQAQIASITSTDFFRRLKNNTRRLG